MPGAESLRRGQYYANPQNQFWRILAELHDAPVPVDYDAKITFLLSRRIAVWDVFKSCERSGSSDGAIRNAVPNDLPAFLGDFPTVQQIVCNGKTAFRAARRVLSLRLPIHPAPSTSPAYTIPHEAKLLGWKEAADWSWGE